MLHHPSSSHAIPPSSLLLCLSTQSFIPMSPTVFFLLFPTIWAWPPPLLATAVRTSGEEGRRCSAQTCGNLTISDPFWLAENQEQESPCGLFDFQVRCKNNTPLLGYTLKSEYRFQILDIFYNNDSLIIVDYHKLEYLNCDNNIRVPRVNTSSKLGLPFKISPINLDLLFYNCTKQPAAEWQNPGLVPVECTNDSFVLVGGPHKDSDDYKECFVEGCNATIVPVLGMPDKVNASHYKQLLRDGFLLTWPGRPEVDPPCIEESPADSNFEEIISEPAGKSHCPLTMLNPVFYNCLKDDAADADFIPEYADDPEF